MNKLPKSKLTKNQTITKTYLNKKYDGEMVDLIVNLRYDDQCGNGHNSFSITGKVYKAGKRGDKNMITAGCCHDAICAIAPELKPLIKWHLVSSDGPMHYIANTIYLSGNKDCYGLKKGESRQIINGKTKLPCWILKEHEHLPKYVDSETKPIISEIKYEYEPLCRIGEGKEPDLEGARACAIWEDATLEQLQDKKLLIDRLPSLMNEFKKAMESLGFVY